MKKTALFILLMFICGASIAQTETLKQEIEKLQRSNANLRHNFDKLEKLVDDILWYNKVGDMLQNAKVMGRGLILIWSNGAICLRVRRRKTGQLSGAGS